MSKDIINFANEMFYKVWNIINEEYVLFPERNFDWVLAKQTFEQCKFSIQTYDELYKLINDILLNLNDTHTRLIYTPASIGMFPVFICYLNGNYYIRNVFVQGTKLKPGMRIITIDNTPPNDIVYNKSIVSKSLLANATIEKIINNEKDSLLITATDETDTVAEVIERYTISNNIINKSSVAPIQLNMCLYTNIKDIANYIRIVSFRSKTVVYDFINSLKLCNHELPLIIDVRDNQGGYIEQTFQILSSFLDEELFMGYKTTRAKGGRHDEFELPNQIIIQPNNQVNFPKIIVLCNEFSMSSTEFIFLRGLRLTNKGIQFIGTKTAGLIHHAFIYPIGYGVKLQFTACRYLDENKEFLPEDGFQPDIEVKNGIEFIRDGVDNQLNYALSFIHNFAVN